MNTTYALRELEKRDLPFINNWRNDKELVDYLGNNFNFIAESVDEAWYENYLRNRQTNLRLAILFRETGETIGTVQLTNIHPVNRAAEFSIMIGNKSFWSKGAGLFATRNLIDHAFTNLNLHRLYLTVLESNSRAIALYRKAGFVEEGVWREAIYKNGTFASLIQMSILKTDKYQ